MERARGAAEPYRALLREPRERLSATLRAIEDRLDRDDVLDPFPFVSASDLAEPLALCRRSLEQTGNGLLARGRLLDLQRRLAAFGVTLVRLDLRQDASRHAEALVGDHRAPRSRQLRGMERGGTAALSAAGARKPPAAGAVRSRCVARSPRGARDVQGRGTPPAGIARRLRHLDDDAALGRARRRAAAEGSAHRIAAAGGPAVRNHARPRGRRRDRCATCWRFRGTGSAAADVRK